MECPRCQQAQLAFDWSIGTMRCSACQYRLYEDDQPAEPAAPPHTPAFTVDPRQPDVETAITQATAVMPAATAPTGKQPPVAFDVPRVLDTEAIPAYLSSYEQVRMRGRLKDAVLALADDDREAFRRVLLSVLEISEDHADTWLHLASMAEDAEEQRRCLEHVVAISPGHPVAMRIMAQLDGRLQETALPASRRKLDEGQVATTRLSCPQCGGTLTYNEATKEVNCAFCGYHIIDADDLDRTDRHSTILEGNVKRKQQAHNWNIGQKWLHCDECGANITISRNTLTNTCRFCQSRHIVQESIQHRFEQPDLIVPFTVDERAAHEAVNTHLSTGLRRITRLFADAVDRIDLQGSYLPFWVFDADMIVNWHWTNAPVHGQHPILLSDILYHAAPTPDRELLLKIEPFHLRKGVDYDPRLLAVHPAQLYALDMTQSSIDVRTRLGREATKKAEPGLRIRRPRGYDREDNPGRLQMNARTQFLTYRLALLPVWTGQLIEEDGDTRQILVNGQTGEVALGDLTKARK